MTFNPRDADHVVMTEADYKAVVKAIRTYEIGRLDPDPLDVTEPEWLMEAQANAAEFERLYRLRAFRSQRRSAIPRGCLWWSAWLVVGAGIWAVGILIVASVLATPSAAPDDSRATLPRDASAQEQRGAPHIPGPSVVRGSLTAGHGGAPQATNPGEPSIPVARTASDNLAGGSPPAVSHGVASWFDARGYQGAVSWWKPGQSPVWATLSRFADGRTYSVTLLITGFCACLAGQPGERLIDVSPAAFRSLGVSLSVGLIRVTMQVPVQGPRLPATDEEGP